MPSPVQCIPEDDTNVLPNSVASLDDAFAPMGDGVDGGEQSLD
jgi:hypothetical protein